MIVIEDIIGQAVKEAEESLRLRTNSDISINFCYGTLREIVGVLNDLGKAKVKKYPLIALIEPFSQSVDNSGIHLSPRFLIATYTKKTLKADQRLEVNYRPVLFPIYEAFIEQLKTKTRSSGLPHTLINHFELGRESLSGYDAATLNDHVDVIEIKDVDLYFKENNNCRLKQQNF